MPIRHLRVSFSGIKIDNTMFVIVSRSKTNSYGLLVVCHCADGRLMLRSWLQNMGVICVLIRRIK